MTGLHVPGRYPLVDLRRATGSTTAPGRHGVCWRRALPIPLVAGCCGRWSRSQMKHRHSRMSSCGPACCAGRVGGAVTVPAQRAREAPRPPKAPAPRPPKRPVVPGVGADVPGHGLLSRFTADAVAGVLVESTERDLRVRAVHGVPGAHLLQIAGMSVNNPRLASAKRIVEPHCLAQCHRRKRSSSAAANPAGTAIAYPAASYSWPGCRTPRLRYLLGLVIHAFAHP
jgi:hypothetical protein